MGRGFQEVYTNKDYLYMNTFYGLATEAKSSYGNEPGFGKYKLK